MINENTINVLKNFHTINPSLKFESSNVIKTISPTKTIMAKATLDESIDATFCVYDLSRFLGALSAVEQPEFDFGDKSLLMKGKNNTKIRYSYAAEETIDLPTKDSVTLPSVDVECKITNQQLQEIQKILGILGLPEIAISGDGTHVYLEALDSKGRSEDNSNIKIGDTDRTFRMIFRADNIKLIEGDYDVQICAQGISQWTGERVVYWIAVENNSTID